MVVAERTPRLQPSSGDPPSEGSGDDPAVSVVIVNWNGERFLCRCLDAVLAQTLPNVEVIVVDNASTDDSLDLVRERYAGRVRIVALDQNTGYSGGANAGFAVGRGEYFALLNNDAFPEPEWLAEMVRAAGEDDDIGMVACKTISEGDQRVIDTAGQVIYGDCISRGRGRLERDRGQYDRIEEVIFPSGSACLIRRDLIADIGPMDGRYWMFMEDSDLGLRARLAGWRCVYTPKARVRHLYSATAGAYSPMKAYHIERNHVWVCVKVLPAPLLAKAAWFTILRLTMQGVGLLSGKGAAARFGESVSKGAMIGTLLRAYRDAALGLPYVLRQRRSIRRSRRLTDAEFAALFRQFRLTAKEVAWRD